MLTLSGVHWMRSVGTNYRCREGSPGAISSEEGCQTFFGHTLTVSYGRMMGKSSHTQPETGRRTVAGKLSWTRPNLRPKRNLLRRPCFHRPVALLCGVSLQIGHAVIYLRTPI